MADQPNLFNEVNCRLKVKTEVDHVPLDLFARILLLLYLWLMTGVNKQPTHLLDNEHATVEELLQLLVGVVDAELFKAVFFEDFEPGNIQDADKGTSIAGCKIQALK